MIAEESGLKYPELVDSYQQSLEEKRLINPRGGNDKSLIGLGKYCRLTTFGFSFCKFIETYEEIEK